MADLIPPHVICEWIGHKREEYHAGYYFDRRGRERTRWHQRCKRCGTSDGGEVFNEGRLERFRVWRLRGALRRAIILFHMWRREDCDDCHQPIVRFGRSVGDHKNCSDIPF
jgi:hypothetical protein